MDDDVVVILTCDGDKSSTEGSGGDSDSDLDSEDDLVIDDLENTHHDEGSSTSEIESCGNEESEGETDVNRALECFERQFYVNLHILVYKVLTKILDLYKIIKKKKKIIICQCEKKYNT